MTSFGGTVLGRLVGRILALLTSLAILRGVSCLRSCGAIVVFIGRRRQRAGMEAGVTAEADGPVASAATLA